MPVVASGVLCAWPSTAASIPSGWSRQSGLDSKYIRGSANGADADLSSSFGTATHNHSEVGSHTPVQNSHTHSVSGGAASAGRRITIAPGDATASTSTHTHAAKTSAAETATNNSSTATLTAYTNNLAYKEVIWIESDGTPTGFPVGSYIYYDSDTLPSGWTRVTGDQYLKGAAAAGNGGGTGGSNTHTHAESGSHTHTQNAHGSGHNSNSSASNSVNIKFGDGASTDSAGGHIHALTFASTTATNNSVSVTTDSVNIEPPYKKLNVISNGGSAADFPLASIAIWGGTNASIPSGWTRYGSMDTYFPKGANANGEATIAWGGTTAGHSHTASCQPTQSSHTHTATGATSAGVCDSVILRSGGQLIALSTHTHTWTVGSTTATNQAATATFDSTSADAHIPPYAKVIFIQYASSLYPYWWFV